MIESTRSPSIHGASRDRADRSHNAVVATMRGGLVLIICVALALTCYFWLSKQQVQQVNIEGNLSYIDKASLQAAINPYLNGGMLSLPIRDIRETVLANKWIDTVSIQKRWPDTLYLLVTEQRPVARWQTEAYLNYRGEAFFPGVQVRDDKLPLLVGGDGYGRETLVIYQQLASVLNVHGLKVIELRRTTVGGHYALLNNGITLSLGTQTVQKNINKFAAVFNGSLNDEIDNIKTIDLRYNNGLAVAWSSTTDTVAAMNAKTLVQGGMYE